MVNIRNSVQVSNSPPPPPVFRDALCTKGNVVVLCLSLGNSWAQSCCKNMHQAMRTYVEKTWLTGSFIQQNKIYTYRIYSKIQQWEDEVRQILIEIRHTFLLIINKIPQKLLVISSLEITTRPLFQKPFYILKKNYGLHYTGSYTR